MSTISKLSHKDSYHKSVEGEGVTNSVWPYEVLDSL